MAEPFRYFYHPDHLGSTSYVTDASGEVYQHLEYFAFGETFVEEHSNTDKTPYLFNGKEPDACPSVAIAKAGGDGALLYGARYYDARTSIFESVDPRADDLSGWSCYAYTLNNPVILTDPDGKYPFDPNLLKKAIANGITTTAEYAASTYRQLSGLANKYPSSIGYVNVFVKGAAKTAEALRNMNTETMGWTDLTNVWLFELGDYKNNTIQFGPNAATTKELQHQEGVSQVRKIALSKIKSGEFREGGSVGKGWTYGQKEFYDGIEEGNLAMSFFGSYTTRIAVDNNKDGSYTLNFTVSNTTGWES
jgi:RHS repeat-associated protein